MAVLYSQPLEIPQRAHCLGCHLHSIGTMIIIAAAHVALASIPVQGIQQRRQACGQTVANASETPELLQHSIASTMVTHPGDACISLTVYS